MSNLNSFGMPKGQFKTGNLKTTSQIISKPGTFVSRINDYTKKGLKANLTANQDKAPELN